MFNIREGIDRKEDCLPERFATKPAGSDKEKHTVDVSKMLPEYYEVRGWDEKGVPKPDHLKKLGVSV